MDWPDTFDVRFDVIDKLVHVYDAPTPEPAHPTVIGSLLPILEDLYS